MQLFSEPDRCTQVRYALVTNTGSVTNDCFSSLSPRCSLTNLQLCINEHENSEVQNGSDIGGSPKQAPQLAGFVNDERLILRSITLWLHCVFSFGPWIPASDSYRLRQRSTILRRIQCSISPTPGSQVFILVFDVQLRKYFTQPGDRHSCQASDTGSALKKERKFSKNTLRRIQSSQKMPGDEAEFSKKAPRHRRNQQPQSSSVWRQILQKRGIQKNSSKWT